VRSRAYYEFNRRGIAFPYPIRGVVRVRPDDPRAAARAATFERVVRGTDIFAPLSDDQCAELVRLAHQRLFGAGETIVREGEPGASVFLVCAGEVDVTMGPAATRVARLPTGAPFGEMSMLTGEPRSATVSAVVDSELLEIAAHDFRRLVLADAELLGKMSVAVAARRSTLEGLREALEPEAVSEAPVGLLERIQQFFR
jgi:CRP-like cAMP-binding protein